MVIFKWVKIGIAFLFLLSCTQKKQLNQKLNKDSNAILLSGIDINEQLKEISLNFVSTHKINNSIIEVDINKREVNQIYLNLTCKGLYYFIVKKAYPLFTYEINNNTFFVFTGSENLLQINFDETKYKNRIHERCDSVMSSCYIIQEGIIKKEDNCTFPDAFSNLPPPSKLPTK